MNRRAQAGFTLVELIIALSLTALILVALGSALHGLGQGFARGTQQADRVDRILRVSQALRNSLLRMTTASFGPAAERPPLVGDAASMVWQAALPDSTPVQGLYRWRLGVMQDALVLQLEAAPEAEAALPPSRLVDDLRTFDVHYQDAASGQWLRRWDARALPLRVRLQIETVSDGPWPPIVVLLGHPT